MFILLHNIERYLLAKFLSWIMKSRSIAYDIGLYIYIYTLLITSYSYSVTIREDDVCVDKPFRPEWL